MSIKKLTVALLFIAFASYVYGEEGKLSSFSKAKKELRKVYSNHQITFYASCKYNYKDKNNMIDRSSCGYVPRNEYTKKGKINKRARRIEWEHVIPAQNFGRQFKCWREGDSLCVKKDGKPYKGRKCCSKVDKKFKIMQADLHNLVPAIGELNADRSNFRYSLIENEPRFYGKNVDFEVDFKKRVAEPKPSIRGDIARIYFYFEKEYDLKISNKDKKLFEVWNRIDPVDKWELEKNEKVYKIQKNRNEFVK
jgi:deoxyribonuclease-1